MSEYECVDWAKEGRKEAIKVMKGLQNFQRKLQKLNTQRDLIAETVFVTKGYFNYSQHNYRVWLESFCNTVAELRCVEWEKEWQDMTSPS